MFRQDNSSKPPTQPVSVQPETATAMKKQGRKLYAIIGALAIVVVIAAAFMFPQGSGSSTSLSLNYAVGEHMVYQTTNVITNQMTNTSLNIPAVTNSQSYNSTTTIDVTDSNSENYTISQTMTATGFRNLPTLNLTVCKASYYNNFIAPGAPLIFDKTNNNSAVSTYLALQSVKVGDVWKIPVNTGNSSLGVTGEVTLTFPALEDFPTSAGTYKTLRIEVTSNTLSVHSDGTGIIKTPSGIAIQLNGTTYIEQDTCRLIKAELTQVITTNSPSISGTATVYTEKTLIEHTKP